MIFVYSILKRFFIIIAAVNNRKLIFRFSLAKDLKIYIKKLFIYLEITLLRLKENVFIKKGMKVILTFNDFLNYSLN